ncbi:pentatricopeptide repeat-containing protein [Roseateles sp. YR242]|uniref:pentatricopeptide repeat-containing protein n=1 Tax=Roseateles sp. YR242 TaxID=1855305 RepID=UPI000B833CAE|nr:pentatricopeptide repeat-containing protein [Roseateles sp. YR242]
MINTPFVSGLRPGHVITAGVAARGIIEARRPGIGPSPHVLPAVRRFGAPAVDRSRIGGGHEASDTGYALNSGIVDEFRAGRINADMLLRMTATVISKECIDQPKLAVACLNELSRAVFGGARVAPNCYVYTAVISTYAKARDPEGALEWFEHLLIHGPVLCPPAVPNVVTYNAVMLAYQKAGNAKGTAKLFVHLMTHGPTMIPPVQPNILTCRYLIFAHTQAHDASGAFNCLKHLLAYGPTLTRPIVPDILIWNAVLLAQAKVGDNIGASECFKLLCSQDASFEPRAVPNDATYLAVMLAHAEAGDPVGANYCFEHLLQNGPHFDPPVVPNIKIYNALLAAHARSEKPEGVFFWWNHLKGRGQELEPKVVPNKHTYRTMIKACKKLGDWAFARAFLEHAIKSGFDPEAAIDGAQLGQLVPPVPQKEIEEPRPKSADGVQKAASIRTDFRRRSI